MNKEKMLDIIGKIADVMEENKQYLTELDTGIGDGDHGINMARGFASVKGKTAEYRAMTCGEILTAVGKTLIRDIAGSSGALYGSAFKAAGKYLGEKEEFGLSDFAEMLRLGIGKIQQLGNAAEGEKTMLDAMFPALRALEGQTDAACLAKAAEAAESAAVHTADYIATKGRASYVGERSIGHRDPGAVSFSLMMKTVAENSI